YTEDQQTLPRIFALETQLASKAALVEQPFRPGVTAPGHEVLQDIDWKAVPPLGGYVATTLKSTADLLLLTHQEDPLLATWRYGLGRAAAGRRRPRAGRARPLPRAVPRPAGGRVPRRGVRAPGREHGRLAPGGAGSPVCAGAAGARGRRDAAARGLGGDGRGRAGGAPGRLRAGAAPVAGRRRPLAVDAWIRRRDAAARDRAASCGARHPRRDLPALA